MDALYKSRCGDKQYNSYWPLYLGSGRRYRFRLYFSLRLQILLFGEVPTNACCEKAIVKKSVVFILRQGFSTFLCNWIMLFAYEQGKCAVLVIIKLQVCDFDAGALYLISNILYSV